MNKGMTDGSDCPLGVPGACVDRGTNPVVERAWADTVTASRIEGGPPDANAKP